jgi:hypothetical protein
MIKKLFFTAALLVPGLAYGADPTANLPIQIVPAAAVPAAAQAAGFNNLIINDNFQSAAFANTATWLDCNDGSTPPSSPLYYRAWIGFGMGLSGPCSAITQTTDPIDGQLSVRLHWQDSYIGAASALTIQTTDNSGNGRQTPPGFYLEVVARTDNATGGSPKPWMGLWSYTTNGGSYELDGSEESGSGVTFAIHNNENRFNNCANPSAGCAPASVDVTKYHTYAWRQTSAGTDIVFCAYIDGVLYGCNTINPTAAELASGSGFTMVHQFEITMPGGGTPLGNGSTGKNAFIRSAKVWSCAGINSGALCRSSSNNP